MKKILVIIVLVSGNCFGQVPADSLVGIYVGQRWYANPSTSPWVISIDTFFVTTIDSVNCLIQASNSSGSYGGGYYTDYYSCNSVPPLNYYMKFYNGDSLKWIDDNVQLPPPNPNSISQRFYGKRIPGTSWVGIGENNWKRNLKIFPNPAKSELTIYLPDEKGNGSLTMYNINGQIVNFLELKNQNVNNPLKIDIQGLSQGLYLLSISINNKTFKTKFIKEK